ncbi:MAG: integrase core domain-containing protein [Dehalococcoidia bacterium]|nr:integrase core domain-containing protein [Dehalococcoidia bacterium]
MVGHKAICLAATLPQARWSHGTHTEEFYEVTDSSFEISELNQALLKWEQVYDTIRPHQALGYLTPQQSLQHHQQSQKKEVKCH